MSEPNTFRFLWKMVDEIEEDNRSVSAVSSTGTIISRYAGILDDRIKNSGHSRSTDSLALYSTEQLKEEIEEREGAQ